MEKSEIFYIKDKEYEELPLVSVIMPVYNAEKYLKNSLHSILEQEYKKIELICINDGSTDNSLAILKNVAHYDKRVVIVNQKENVGPAKARNAGLDLAKGKYISFVDSDDSTDMWMYYCLVEQAENENADIIVFGGTPFPDSNRAPEWIWEKMSPPNKVYEKKDAGKNALFLEKSSKPFLWLHFIKREILETEPKLRLDENLDLGEDQVFQFMYFPRAKKVVFIDKRFYWYRWVNEGSIMWKYNKMKTEKFRKHLEIVKLVFEGWKKSNYSDPYGELVSWMVDFLYPDIVTFPKFQRHIFAKEIIKIMNNYGQAMFMCNEYVMEMGKEIEEWAEELKEPQDMVKEDIDKLSEEIMKKEKEIISILNSKAFKVGRMLTPKRKRLNIESVLPKEEKKN